MSQDGWGDTPYKKKAPRKKVVKGCPGNGGKAHLYEVTKRWHYMTWKKSWSFRYVRPTCVLCNHQGPQSPKSPKYSVIRTQVLSTQQAGVVDHEYEGDTDQDGCPTPRKDF